MCDVMEAKISEIQGILSWRAAPNLPFPKIIRVSQTWDKPTTIIRCASKELEAVFLVDVDGILFALCSLVCAMPAAVQPMKLSTAAAAA